MILCPIYFHVICILCLFSFLKKPNTNALSLYLKINQLGVSGHFHLNALISPLRLHKGNQAIYVNIIPYVSLMGLIHPLKKIKPVGNFFLSVSNFLKS